MTAAAEPRIAPLSPPYEPQTAAMLERWMPPGAGVEPLALFRTLAVHDELASRMRPLGAGILGHGRVAPRLREVMIHRTCALNGAEYEWGVHAASFGAALGFSDAQLASTVTGERRSGLWDEQEDLVMRLAGELHATSDVSDELFGALREQFAEDEVLELVVTAGWYRTLAQVIAVARLAQEPWARRFADVAP